MNDAEMNKHYLQKNFSPHSFYTIYKDNNRLKCSTWNCDFFIDKMKITCDELGSKIEWVILLCFLL